MSVSSLPLSSFRLLSSPRIITMLLTFVGIMRNTTKQPVQWTVSAFSLSKPSLKLDRTTSQYNPFHVCAGTKVPIPILLPNFSCSHHRTFGVKQYTFPLFSTNLSVAESEQAPNVDRILSKLTSLFPLFVLGAAALGSFLPKTLDWVNSGDRISLMLTGVMLGTGMTLERSDFTDILTSKTERTSIPIGVLCQFILMPLSASIIGRNLLLPYGNAQASYHAGKNLFLGLVLVGCSPGGTASNLVSLIARADVALSVLLTTCSTVLASVVTPLLTKFIIGSTVSVSGKALCITTANVVLAPVILGMILNEKVPEFCRWVSRWTPFASVILVSLICGGVMANNSLMSTGNVGGAFGGVLSLLFLTLLSVILTHTLGFASGYIVPKLMFKCSEKTSRTISIETGMQNSALAVVLAKSIGADPLSYIPGAISATVHSCLGSGLAAFWRYLDSRKGE